MAKKPIEKPAPKNPGEEPTPKNPGRAMSFLTSNTGIATVLTVIAVPAIPTVIALVLNNMLSGYVKIEDMALYSECMRGNRDTHRSDYNRLLDEVSKSTKHLDEKDRSLVDFIKYVEGSLIIVGKSRSNITGVKTQNLGGIVADYDDRNGTVKFCPIYVEITGGNIKIPTNYADQIATRYGRNSKAPMSKCIEMPLETFDSKSIRPSDLEDCEKYFPKKQ